MEATVFTAIYDHLQPHAAALKVAHPEGKSKAASGWNTHNVSKLIHSSRSNIAGSIESARCAGIHVATNPSNAIARTTPANTSGSRGVA
jgi:hypothetical protein